jgi:NADPH-dependent glutamate synthase beta subunit-like oxidoreductase
VAINYLKRYAADFERQKGDRVLPYKAPASGRTLAVIGGGVEGLSTAFFSARLGHEVTVYEATDRLGGLLRSAIARERLPEKILEWDLGGITDMGVNVEYGKMLGRDIQIAELLDKGHEAVFLATGGWDGRLARGGSGTVEVPIPGTSILVDFLKSTPGQSTGPTIKSDVAIFGGGKLALAAAEKCRQNGAGSVTVLLRESQEASKLSDEQVASSGAEVVFGASVSRMVGEKDQLLEIEILEIASGNKRIIPAQTLLLAAGRLPEMIFQYPLLPVEEGAETQEDEGAEEPATVRSTRWEGILPYKQPLHIDQKGIFSEGDVLSDYSAAIKAIGAGRRGAVSLHQVLYGLGPSLTDNVITPESHIQNVDAVEAVADARREIMPLRSGLELVRGDEIEKGFSEAVARKEASRCLQCGLICYNQTGEPESLDTEEATA